MDIQVLLLSTFFAFSMGLTVWALISLNQEARSAAQDVDELFTDGPVFRLALPYIQTLGRALEGIKGLDKTRKDVSEQLRAAGKADAITPDEFIATQLIAGIAAMVAGWYFQYQLSLGIEMILGFFFIGYLLPSLALRDTVKKRQRAIRRALPYTLDLLTLAVEAGLDFTTALAKIAAKLEGNPLGPEVKRLVRDLTMGKTRRQGLKDMADRTGLEELSTVVQALIQADELGASLGPTLRIQSSEMRRKRFDRAEKLAQEAPVKMLGPLIFFIFPVVFIIIFGPIFLRFYYDNPVE